MSIYRTNPQRLPDSRFEPGELALLVAGNRGRLLDPRRTPVVVTELRPAIGTFVVRIEDFEDRGAVWEVALEKVVHYQFARGSRRATPSEVSRLQDAVVRFDRPLRIACTSAARSATEARLDVARDEAGLWLASRSRFLAEGGRLPDVDRRRGDPRLIDDLRRFMTERDLWDVEEAFTRQHVSNPYSGELVKGHRIVLAELGMVPYEGTVVRDPAIFDGPWSRTRRADHVLTRLAFVSALFTGLGCDRLVLYRGLSTEGPLVPPSNETFVSATFAPEVARSHFEAGEPFATRGLYRQAVPIERVFMTYHETAAMNDRFLEAEAVLLFDAENRAF